MSGYKGWNDIYSSLRSSSCHSIGSTCAFIIVIMKKGDESPGDDDKFVHHEDKQKQNILCPFCRRLHRSVRHLCIRRCRQCACLRSNCYSKKSQLKLCHSPNRRLSVPSRVVGLRPLLIQAEKEAIRFGISFKTQLSSAMPLALVRHLALPLCRQHAC